MRISDWRDVCSADLRHRRAPSRVESRQASDAAVLLPTLREAAHDDLIDIVGVQAVARLERAEHRREDALGMDRRQCALSGLPNPPRSSRRVDDPGLTHSKLLAIGNMSVPCGSDPPRCRLGTQRSEEHTSELQSLMRISYAVSCLKKKK